MAGHGLYSRGPTQRPLPARRTDRLGTGPTRPRPVSTPSVLDSTRPQPSEDESATARRLSRIGGGDDRERGGPPETGRFSAEANSRPPTADWPFTRTRAP